MFTIVNKQMLSRDVKRLDILAPLVATSVLPGQFVMVSPEEHDTAIPLAVVESDPVKGTVTLIVHESGTTTRHLGDLRIDENIFALTGPLGRPARIKMYGMVLCVATGESIAQLLPICRVLKKEGNKVIGIIGARNRDTLILETQMRLACHKIYITTDDGSYRRQGKATALVKELLATEKVDCVYATGSIKMMESMVSEVRPYNIPLRVQVNAPMLCGNGLCGSCRVRVGSRTQLACCDGLELNGYSVDFAELRQRRQGYDRRDVRRRWIPDPQDMIQRVRKFWTEIEHEKN